VAFASLCYRSAQLNGVGAEPKGSNCNLKNLECTTQKTENATFVIFGEMFALCDKAIRLGVAGLNGAMHRARNPPSLPIMTLTTA